LATVEPPFGSSYDPEPNTLGCCNAATISTLFLITRSW
jgi:hypothetical protein